MGSELSGSGFDLDAYLERIGLSGRPGLFEVHRAHVTSIPFENLDPRRGIPVSLELDALQGKLVAAGRGGYCFEQNLLLAAALRELGMEVETMLARVRTGGTPGTLRPRSHLVLRVRDGAGVWHADAGFGMGTLLDPIPFGPGGVAVQAGWSFRVVAEDGEFVLQAFSDDQWLDQYAFPPVPAPLVDIQVSNWYTSTFPRSPFVTGLIVAVQRGDGSRASLRDWDGLELIEETPHGRTVTAVRPGDVPMLLRSSFGLDGDLVALSPGGKNPDEPESEA